MTVFQVHGLLQVLAFAVLFPVGALVALFRQNIGDRWRKIHVTIQLIAVACVFVAVTIVHLGASSHPKTDTSLVKYHRIIGPTVVFLICLQLLWAVYGKHAVDDWNTWLRIHMINSVCIISLGLVNMYIGWKMQKT